MKPRRTRDIVVAAVESAVLVVYTVILLAMGGGGYLAANGITGVLLAAATAVSTSLQFRVSTSRVGRQSFGASAGFLGIALIPGAHPELVLCWAVGLGIGWSVISRSLFGGARVAGRAVVLGSVYLVVWQAVGVGYGAALAASAATAAYLVVALAIMSIPELVEGVRPRQVAASLLPWRIMFVFAIDAALVIAVDLLGTWLSLADEASRDAFSILIPLATTAAVVAAIGMLRTARIARQRLDGVFAAALALPWPPDEDPLQLMRRFAAQALRAEHVDVRSEAPDPRHEIGSAFQTPDGETHYLVARRSPGRSPFIDRDAQTLLAIAHIGQDAMRERLITEGLLTDARTDPLTGLPNYRAFQHALEAASRVGPIAVAYIDLDGFKAVNDGHGHEVGNRVLQVIANRLSRAVRPTDFVARVGGDEFVVILTEVGDLEHAEQIVARIVRSVSPPIDLGSSGVVVLTFSTGISFSPGGRELDPLRIVEEADARMYASRGRVAMGVSRGDDPAPPDLGDASQSVAAVAETIDGQYVTPHYQPIIDNVLGEVIGYEALVRSTHPDYDGISPALLVHEARRTGRLDMLTEQLLARVAEDSTRIRAVVPELHDVHVNVEVDQLTARRVLPFIHDIVVENPELHLTLEMTENSLNRATDLILADLRALKGSGLQFALDDFGQAYSTMLAIVQYPFNILKVDRALVSDDSDALKSRQVMRSLVMLSRKLGVTMVVEGVETISERDWLARLGVRYMQGFLFGRPRPIDEVLADLERGGRRVANATRPEL